MFDRMTIIAGRRWGKSKVGSVAGVEEATVPGTIGWACAPTNQKLHRYVIPAFEELIPENWVKSWSAEFNDLRLINNSLIHFQTLEDPDQGRGQGLDWLWIDEVCELTRKHWDIIRPSLAGDTVAFFTTSPRSYDWVYEELYKPAEDGLPGYWACHARTADSANPRINAEFLAREREQMSETMYRQEYEADFVHFTGSVYGDALSGQILRTDAEIKRLIPEWPEVAGWRQVIVGIDTGADHPFGAVKLVNTESGLVVIGDYLERHRTFMTHCSDLHRLAASTSTRWACNKNERQGMLELSQHNITCWPANNDVVAGTERVKSWLEHKQLFFYEPMCRRTIQQMMAYRWAENTSPKTDEKRTEKVFKKDDELPDCLRYALMTWPQLPGPRLVAKPQRDITNLPPEMRSAIERMRRIDAEPEPAKDTTGDFWK
jgi:hypothetical protein